MFRLLSVFFVPLSVVSSCGGDASSTEADAAFCKEIERLDNLDIETDLSEAAEILAQLAEKAPNGDVRQALDVIVPIFERLSTIDQNDMNAMGEMFDLMSSPDVVAASEVLDAYGTEVCGFDDSEEPAPDSSTP